MAADEAPEPAQGSRPRTFAQKLQRLLAVMHPPGRPPMSDRALAARIREQGGSISPAYLSELKAGKKANPGLEHLLQIATAFGVSAGYFTDPEVAERIDRDLDKLEERHRTDDLQELAARTASLQPGDRVLLGDLVKREIAKRSPSDGQP